MDMKLAFLRFRQQRHNAEVRGIEWKFTFDEWCKVWQDSGHWLERGVGGYCMCRVGDRGPYAASNVFIDTSSVNSSSIERPRKSGLPRGVKPTRYGTYEAYKSRRFLGTFKTPELAAAAYLSPN